VGTSKTGGGGKLQGRTTSLKAAVHPGHMLRALMTNTNTVMEIRPQAILMVFELKVNNAFRINELLQKLWILINYSARPVRALKYSYVSKFSGEIFLGIARMK
jgi:hypothetical protein